MSARSSRISVRRASSRRAILLGCALAALGLAACRTTNEVLMPSPVLYRGGGLDPFAHLPPDARTPSVRLFYTTARQPGESADDPYCGNRSSRTLRLGRVSVRIGDEGMTWDDLHADSMAEERAESIPLRIASVAEVGTLDSDGLPDPSVPLSGPVARFTEALNAELAATRDRELLVYIHGTKVSFYRGCVRAAEAVVRELEGRW